MDFNNIDTLVKQYSVITEKIDTAILKTCLRSIDMTSLNHTDSEESIATFVNKINTLNDNLQFAAICVYPSFVKTVKKHLTSKTVKIAAVAGGFPSSQTFTDIKVAECKEAIKAGADELDIVILVGEFLAGEYDKVAGEISKIKKEIGDIHLKVILETGTLKSPELIYKASMLAMESGADFIKTSTGKTEPAATPEAFLVMALAVRDFYNKTGKRVGLKAAGGISTANEAYIYYNIFEKVLGKEYINPNYFRIGASRLANNLLSEIEGKPVKIF